MCTSVDIPGSHHVYMIMLDQQSHSKGQVKSFLTFVECNPEDSAMLPLGKCIARSQGRSSTYKRFLPPLNVTEMKRVLQVSLGTETDDLLVLLCTEPSNNENTANTLRWGASLQLSHVSDKPMGETFDVPADTDKLIECIELLQKIKDKIKTGRREAKRTVNFHPVRSKRYLDEIGNLINSEV